MKYSKKIHTKYTKGWYQGPDGTGRAEIRQVAAVVRNHLLHISFK